MSKAILSLNPGLWLLETQSLTNEEKGAYFTLLLASARNRLTDHKIKIILGDDYDHLWPKIAHLFIKSGSDYISESHIII